MSETVTRYLPVKLTEDEITERGRTIAERLKKKSGLEAEKAGITRSFGEQIKDINGEIKALSDSISKGEELRPVKCSERLDTANKTYRLRRNDTGEIVEERPMTKGELSDQPDMFPTESEEPEGRF